jgi:hypothetical protein
LKPKKIKDQKRMSVAQGKSKQYLNVNWLELQQLASVQKINRDPESNNIVLLTNEKEFNDHVEHSKYSPLYDSIYAQLEAIQINVKCIERLIVLANISENSKTQFKQYCKTIEILFQNTRSQMIALKQNEQDQKKNWFARLVLNNFPLTAVVPGESYLMKSETEFDTHVLRLSLYERARCQFNEVVEKYHSAFALFETRIAEKSDQIINIRDHCDMINEEEFDTLHLATTGTYLPPTNRLSTDEKEIKLQNLVSQHEQQKISIKTNIDSIETKSNVLVTIANNDRLRRRRDRLRNLAASLLIFFFMAFVAIIIVLQAQGIILR